MTLNNKSICDQNILIIKHEKVVLPQTILIFLLHNIDTKVCFTNMRVLKAKIHFEKYVNNEVRS